jgi:hypothetical protein
MRCARQFVRRFLSLVVAASVFLQDGCVTVAPPAPTAAVGTNLGVMAIAPAQYVPPSNFVTFAKGAGAGAAKGAAVVGAPAAGMSAILAASAAGTFVYPVAILMGVMLTATSTAVGAVEGAKAAVPTEMAKQVESAINRAVAGLDAQNKLAGQVALLVNAEPWIRLSDASPAGPSSLAARPDYAPLQTAGINTVLEIAVTEIGFESCGSEFVRRLSSACVEAPNKRMVDLFMFAQARLVRVSDGAEIFARQIHYKSARREVPRWMAKDGQLLAEEFDYAYRELAERVRDEVLLVASIELPAPSSFPGIPGDQNPMYGICWLAPVDPKVKPVLIPEIASLAFKKTDICPASGMHFSTVESLRPSLRWSGFPRDLDRQNLDPAVLQKISNVTYDLKIWQEEGCERGRPVYERTGLATPAHVVEEALAPASRYFWSVRARFTLDDRPMVTRWAHFDVMSCFSNDMADWQYYRFITP